MKFPNRAKALYTLGHWRHVPVQLHWSILLVLPWYYLSTWKLMEATIAMVAFAMLLLIHELGHALVAHWRGLQIHAITLYLLHGQCHTEEPYYEEDDVWVAWGGVAAQLLVLVMATLISYPLQAIPHETRELLKPLFMMLIPVNVITIIINLIPVRPLDGYKAWRVIPLLYKHFQRNQIPRSKRRLRVVASTSDAKRITENAIKKMMEK